jgi:hypothetical protein
MQNVETRRASLFSIGLGLIVIALEGLIYILFEFQNAWPYNEDIFLLLRTVSIIGISVSTLFSIIYPRPYTSLLSLLLSIVLVTAVSRSDINLTSLSVNFVAAFLILLSTRRLASLRGR